MTNVPYTLQDFPWEDSIAAVKASEQFHSYADFYPYMVEHLQQNSPETRRRYAELIQRRFFLNKSLDDLIPTVWRTYHDEPLLAELMRVTVLEAEPVVARFVLSHVLPEAPGTVLTQERTRHFEEFVQFAEFELHAR